MRYILLLLLSTNLFSQSTDELNAKSLYEKRGESFKTAQASIEIYENLLKETSNKEKICFYANQISYLYFFWSGQKNSSLSKKERLEKERLLCEKSYESAKKCTALFGDSLEVSDYKSLTKVEKKEFARALALLGTSLSRKVEIEDGDSLIPLKILDTWNNIVEPTMNFIKQLGYADVFYYGADRTLGIANTKMPALFADREIAKESLESSVRNTLWENRTISKYPINSIFLADYYNKIEEDKTKSCDILKEIIDLKNDEIKKENSELYYETITDQKTAKERFLKFDCK